VTPLPIVEHLDVVEGLRLRDLVRLEPLAALELEVEFQPSIAALSRTSNLRIMLQVMPCAASTSW